MSNYILWGKNSQGKNAQQEGYIELKKWTQENVESIDGLLEMPGFQEASFHSLKEPRLKTAKICFDRERALKEAPEATKQIFLDLFKQIDTIDLTINYYDLFHGRRSIPPREKLLNSFTKEERQQIQEKAEKLGQYKYLKLKRLLVELRSDQYSYYDTYAARVGPGDSSWESSAEEPLSIRIGEDIDVFPLGLKDSSKISQLLFQKELYPSMFNEEELKQISDFLWQKKGINGLDFTNVDHLLQTYKMRAELWEEQERDPDLFYGAAGGIIDTLIFYEQQAQLTPLQKDILEAKLKKTSNICIAERINKKYNKTYNDNYISTIFHQKILPQIAAAAQNHLLIVENLFYPENFKKCRDCGKILFISTDNFMHQKKSSDGFSSRCKKCEKIKRDGKK